MCRKVTLKNRTNVGCIMNIKALPQSVRESLRGSEVLRNMADATIALVDGEGNVWFSRSLRFRALEKFGELQVLSDPQKDPTDQLLQPMAKGLSTPTSVSSAVKVFPVIHD